jgi:hypothetical protein
MMKDGYLITSVYFGNTLVDLYGYDGEIEYAYIGDENITEMLIELKVWDKVVEEAEEEIANGY